MFWRDTTPPGWRGTLVALGVGVFGCADFRGARFSEQPTAPAAQTILVEVSGSQVSVDGKSVSSDPAQIRKALTRSGKTELVLRADAESNQSTIAQIVHQASSTNLTRLSLEVGALHASIMLNTSEPSGHSRWTTLVGVVSADTGVLWSIDNQSGGFSDLGSWQLGNTASEATIREQVERSCRPDDCRVSLEIRQDESFVSTLRAWQRIHDDARVPLRVSIVSFHIKSTAPATPKPAQAAQEAAPGGDTAMKGRLPPSLIQAIVRANFQRFRRCYGRGLARDPELEGTVVARFVVSRDGTVGKVSDGGSTIPDSSVKRCVLNAFYALRFPQPDGGIVTVVYPIRLTPD